VPKSYPATPQVGVVVAVADVVDAVVVVVVAFPDEEVVVVVVVAFPDEVVVVAAAVVDVVVGVDPAAQPLS
jgi:hypothetical protein